MSQPMMLITLDVAADVNSNTGNALSVSVVGSMNVYFTKFTALQTHCPL
jgi:hypothetical protein